MLGANPPTLTQALPRLADLFDRAAPQPFFRGSKVPELEELALTETQLLEQTAALLGMDAARGPSFAADQDEGPQRGPGRPIPPLVSKIQVATTNAGVRAQGGLTPDFLALST